MDRILIVGGTTGILISANIEPVKNVRIRMTNQVRSTNNLVR